MRLLITGAAGFLGRNALLAISPSWEVVAFYRPGNTGFLHFLETQQLHHVQAIAVDLTQAHEVEQVMKRIGGRFDSCLALASNTSIPDSLERPVQDLTTNVVGLLHILQCCSFDHFVYLSSGAVYIGLAGLVGPTSAVSPTLPYAISKLAAEQYIRAFAQHRQTLRHATILRFFGAYGPYEPTRKLYTKLVRHFAFERNPHFTAMYIDDAIRALLSVLAFPPTEGVRCIDLGVGRGERVNEIVKQAAHAFGLEPIITHEGFSPEYIQFFIDPIQFSSLYQFTPQVSLETGLLRLTTHLERESRHVTS